MNLYLKSSVKAEPLVWGWYAWSHLISPLTAAMNITNRHMRLMQSYVEAPHIHAMAAKNPSLLGGNFIDLEGKYVKEVKTLIDQTKQDCQTLIRLAQAIKEFDNKLQDIPKGTSLENFYKNIPNEIKGCTELVYDLNSQPSIRFIEPLVYKRYYSDKPQSIALSDTAKDFRPFSLSTPRIQKPEEVHIEVPLASESLDALFTMQNTPKKGSDIKDLFDIPENKKELFENFFTEVPPNIPKDSEYDGKGVRVRYFGHACVLLQTKDISILIDPVVSYNYVQQLKRFTIDDLPHEIDYVLLSHGHQDHIMLETLLRIRHKIKTTVIPPSNRGFLADPSLKLILHHLGFKSVISLEEMESISFPEGEIMGIPFLGEHADLNIQSKLCYYVRLANKKFLFAVDSNNLEHTVYDLIFDSIGTIDTLFIGMECEGAPLSWLYGSLLTKPLSREFDNARRLSGSNFESAWSIVEKSRCQNAYVYAMGQEPWLNHVMAFDYSPESIQMQESDKLVNIARSKGINSERLYVKGEWVY